jgi:molybdopterin-guanine dinucleotide biosynthesis protein A
MIAGVILAGGRSSRMGGGDKALLRLGGGTILSHVIRRLAPQVGALALNANGEAARFAAYGLPVLPDAVAGFQGPLAGIHAGLAWATGLPGVTHLATVSADAPFLPPDLAERLAAEDPRLVAVSRSAGRLHPTCALWPVGTLGAIEAFLRKGETRRVMTFIEQAGYRAVDFDADPFDPFFNVNTPGDLATAVGILERGA